MSLHPSRARWWIVAAAVAAVPIIALAASPSGAIFTTTPDGGIVNENVHYTDKREVYLDGGPPPNAPASAAGLDAGLYVFQVTDPSGQFLLSKDPARCRVVEVSAAGVIVALVPPSNPAIGASTDNWADGGSLSKGGPKALDPTAEPCHIADPPHPPEPAGPGDFGTSGRHDTNTDVDHGADADAIVVQLMPYGTTPNPGGVYKAWMTPIASYVAKGGDLNQIPAQVKGRRSQPCPDFCADADPGFGPSRADVKTDNYKVEEQVPPPMLHVRKFHDVDGDGEWDEGEPEIGEMNPGSGAECVDATGAIVDCSVGGGWPVEITDPNGVTNPYFTPVWIVSEPPGNWLVEETTFGGDWIVSVAFLDGVSQGATTSVPVVVAGGPDESHEVIFGNFVPGEIRGRKVIDLDGDGVIDPEDTCPLDPDTWSNNAGCQGVTVKLTGTTNAGDPVDESTTTDSDGKFAFTGLYPGTYALGLDEPVGFDCSYPDPCNYSGIVISSGTVVEDQNFADFQNATKSGTKFHDLDADGVRDAGEPGLENWTIEIAGTDGMGNAVNTMVATDADGKYSFDVPPGSYTVSEVCTGDWRQSLPAPASDAPADCGTGEYDITLVSGEVDSGNDFGNYKNATKSGRKIHDLNGNGLAEVGEPGLEGWEIRIVSTDGGGVSQTAHTDATGAYSFSVRPGAYRVSEVCPAGWLQSAPAPSGGCGTGVYNLTLTSGANHADNDFLNFQPVDVHAHKFFDADEDGTPDPAEADLEGIEFCISSGGNPVTTDAFGNPVTACKTTNADGLVWWTDLRPGSYTVTETVPPGCFPTTPNPQSATLTSGQSVTFEFGDVANCVGLTPGYWKNWRNHYTEQQFLLLLAGTIADGSIPDADAYLTSTGCDGSDALHCMEMFLLANQLTLNLTQHPELPNPSGGSLYNVCQVPGVPDSLGDWLQLALAIHEAGGAGYTREQILQVKTVLDQFANMSLVFTP